MTSTRDRSRTLKATNATGNVNSVATKSGRSLNYVWMIEDGRSMHSSKSYGRLKASQILNSIPFVQKYNYVTKQLALASVDLKCSGARLIVMVMRESTSLETSSKTETHHYLDDIPELSTVLEELRSPKTKEVVEIETQEEKGVEIAVSSRKDVQTIFLMSEEGYDCDGFQRSRALRKAFKFLKSTDAFDRGSEWYSGDPTILDRDTWYLNAESHDITCDLNFISSDDIVTMVKYDANPSTIGKTTHWRVKTADPIPTGTGFFDISGSGDWRQVYSKRWGKDARRNYHVDDWVGKLVNLVQFLWFAASTFARICFSLVVNFIIHSFDVSLYGIYHHASMFAHSNEWVVPIPSLWIKCFGTGSRSYLFSKNAITSSRGLPEGPATNQFWSVVESQIYAKCKSLDDGSFRARIKTSVEPDVVERTMGFKFRKIDFNDFYDAVNTQPTRLGTFYLIWFYLIFWGVCGYFRHVMGDFFETKTGPDLNGLYAVFWKFSLRGAINAMLSVTSFKSIIGAIIGSAYTVKEFLALLLIATAPFWIYRWVIKRIYAYHWADSKLKTTPAKWSALLKKSKKSDLGITIYCYAVWLLTLFFVPFFYVPCKLYGIFCWCFGSK
jgi:hypothetical protein